MNIKSKFFSPLHRELLELAEYHKKVILENKKSGGKDQDDEDRLKMLNSIPRLVNDNVANKERYEISQRKEEQELLVTRQTAECPQCDTDREVKILRETKHSKFGWQLDVVECTVCKKVFTNYFPNNWHDRMKWMENFYSKMFEVKDDGKTMAEFFETENVIQPKMAYEQFLDFKKAQLNVEKAEKAQLDALVKADEALNSLHSHLLSAKVKNQQWNLPPGVN